MRSKRVDRTNHPPGTLSLSRRTHSMKVAPPAGWGQVSSRVCQLRAAAEDETAQSRPAAGTAASNTRAAQSFERKVCIGRIHSCRTCRALARSKTWLQAARRPTSLRAGSRLVVSMRDAIQAVWRDVEDALHGIGVGNATGDGGCAPDEVAPLRLQCAVKATTVHERAAVPGAARHLGLVRWYSHLLLLLFRYTIDTANFSFSRTGPLRCSGSPGACISVRSSRLA